MDKVFFVTSNEGKFKEFKELLCFDIERFSFDIPELQSVEVEEVVYEKVLTVYRSLGNPVFVEDTGLYFQSLNGLPGALIRSFQERLSLEEICGLLKDNREALAKTCIAYSPDGKEVIIFKGEVRGTIAFSPQGENGFGWDAIFIPLGEEKTFAQMSQLEKDRFSMRRIAIDEFRDYLKG